MNKDDKRKERKRIRERSSWHVWGFHDRLATSGTRSFNLTKLTESELKMWSALKIGFQEDSAHKDCDPGWQAYCYKRTGKSDRDSVVCMAQPDIIRGEVHFAVRPDHGCRILENKHDWSKLPSLNQDSDWKTP
jgi:hypothetical protein